MSSLQQPMQQPNITDLNNLLQEASNSIICGPECQRTNTKKKLYQNYLDAKSNLENGPNIVNERAKQYYMYSEGPIGYNNYINQDLEQQLNVIDNNLIEKFNNNLNQAKTNVELYKGVSVNYLSVIELYEYYLNNNKELEEKYKNTRSTILTNDRKTYYENQGIDYLTSVYLCLVLIYVSCSIIFLIRLFGFNNYVSLMKKIIILLFIILYPFFFMPLIKYILFIYSKISVLFPKNIYNKL